MEQSNYFKPFLIRMIPKLTSYDGVEKLTAHKNIIHPLMEAAKEAVVYKGTIEPHEIAFGGWIEPIDMKSYAILTPDRGKYRFDLSRECVYGYEPLWNATTYRRGSIVIILPSDFDFNIILPHCFSGAYSLTPNMGESPAAIKKCKIEMSNGNIAVTISASNGMDWMQVYADEKLLQWFERYFDEKAKTEMLTK